MTNNRLTSSDVISEIFWFCDHLECKGYTVKASELPGRRFTFDFSRDDETIVTLKVGIVAGDRVRFSYSKPQPGKSEMAKHISKALGEWLERSRNNLKRLELVGERVYVRVNRSELLEQIRNCFTGEELKTLCHGLGVDYDDLPGEDKPGKIKELITYFKRREDLMGLIEALQRERPKADWEKCWI